MRGRRFILRLSDTHPWSLPKGGGMMGVLEFRRLGVWTIDTIAAIVLIDGIAGKERRA